MSEAPSKNYLFGAAFLLMGLAIIYKWLPISIDLQFNSLKTEAEVVRVSELREYKCGHRITGLLCDLGFTDKRKYTRFNHELRFGDTRVFIKEDTKYKEGQLVPILYLEELPKYSRITGAAWANHWAAPIGGLVIGAIGILLVFREFKNA